ncbi:hypothetical protein SAMN04487779_1002396 [Belnapia rosea]|uniref:Uncharacterized protein n=1 Tax=Belnapia rosea TaxID=938405 RepID=A0A1G6PJS2_9PROT|nr:hypothetical protein SAMN04487779_1002396 [Belnapia rosea]
MLRGWTGLGLVLPLLLAAPALAQPQPRPGQTPNSQTPNSQTPNSQAPGGQPPLTVEPGDFWSDVRAWDEQARRRLGRNAAPAMPRPGGAIAAPNPGAGTAAPRSQTRPARPRRPAPAEGR